MTVTGRTSRFDWPYMFIPFIVVIFTFLTRSFSITFGQYRYGGERYEKRDLQIRVRQRFRELQTIDEKQGRVAWHIVDASQSIEEVKDNIADIVTATIERVQKEISPLGRMWGEGDYELPEITETDDTTTTTE